MDDTNMAGLSIYGVAAGAIWARCCTFGVGVHTVGVNEWSRGTYSTKTKRRNLVAAMFGNVYSVAADRKLDMSDAIALGLWWLSERGISVDNPLT